jgi:radical SAM protein with 4Fe4S-binding SPASM domain
MVIVDGAKYSACIDFKNTQIFRLNSSARTIIKIGEEKLTIAEAAERLKPKFEAKEVTSFIEELHSKGIVELEESTSSDDVEPEKILPKLNMLWIETTCECNLRCIHCYASAEDKSKTDNLSTEEIKQVLDEASQIGCHDVQFTGGEATLRSDLKQLIDCARAKNINVEVFTNGTNLNESWAEFFSEKSVQVAMSIYSHKAGTHDAITGVPGSFERSINSLKQLKAHGVTVRCAIVAMKTNEDELEETIRFLSNFGAKIRLPDPIRPSGRGKGLENWPEKYGLKFLQTKPAFIVNRSLYERNRQWNNCWYGKAAITCRGDVLPCVFARDQIVGNIRKQKLSRIVRSKALLSLWRLTKDKVEVCKNCEYRYVCEDCRPWATGLTDNLCAKSPRCTYDPYTGEWVNVLDPMDEHLKCSDIATNDTC